MALITNYENSEELESMFVEVLEPGMSKNNMIIGCIELRMSLINHHFISVATFFQKKICKEKKMVVLPGDFNADLLKYHDEEVADFLEDTMYIFQTTIT